MSQDHQPDTDARPPMDGRELADSVAETTGDAADTACRPWDEDRLAVMDGCDLNLIRAIRDIGIRPHWQGLALAAVLHAHAARLDASLQALPAPEPGSALFTRLGRVWHELNDSFEAVLLAVCGCQDALRREFRMARRAEDLSALRLFSERFEAEVEQLERYYAKVAALRPPRRSACRELQLLVLAWGGFFKDRVQHLGDVLQAEPAARPEISLIPPSLPRFYRVRQSEMKRPV